MFLYKFSSPGTKRLREWRGTQCQVCPACRESRSVVFRESLEFPVSRCPVGRVHLGSPSKEFPASREFPELRRRASLVFPAWDDTQRQKPLAPAEAIWIGLPRQRRDTRPVPAEVGESSRSASHYPAGRYSLDPPRRTLAPPRG